MKMTQAEYKARTADGSLSVADVLDNLEFATDEQLLDLRNGGELTALLNNLRAEAASKRTTVNLIRKVAEALGEIHARQSDTMSVSRWGQLSGQGADVRIIDAELKSCRPEIASVAKEIMEALNDGVVIGDDAELLRRYLDGVICNTINEINDAIGETDEIMPIS